MLRPDVDNTPTVQAMLNGGGLVQFPPGQFPVHNSVRVRVPGTVLMGYGTTFVGGHGMRPGANGLIEIDASGVKAHGFHFDMRERVSCFRINPSTDRRGFLFTDMTSANHFYFLKGGISRSPHYVHDIQVSNIRTVGPDGQFHGHFLFHSARDIQMANCHATHGENASVFGFGTDCSGITLTNLIARGNADTQPSDGSIQIENSPEANAEISNCSLDHDLWVDDSSGVRVAGGSARKLRITVQTNDSKRIQVTGGSYSQIAIDDFARRQHGVLVDRVCVQGVELDPEREQAARAMYLNGAVMGKVSIGGYCVSNGTSENLRLTRSDTLDLSVDVDFNGGTVRQYGTGGRVRGV